MLHRLIFDATILDDGANVGSWLRAGTDGSLISSGDGSADNVASTFEGIDTRGFLFGYDSVGGNWDRLQSSSGNLHVDIKSPLEVDVLIEAEKVEDTAHASGDIGNFVLAIRDDGVQASAVSGGATFTAVNYGVSGNSISLVFDGIDDIDTVVAAWNLANPSNQVTFTGVVGTTVLGAQTVTLANGAQYTEFTSDSGDYSGISVDQYGRVRTSDEDLLAEIQGGVTVTATNLDIRDLAFATDSVTAYQGTSPWVVSATDLDIRDLNSATDSVTVLATDLDIRDISHVSDSIRLGDGTNLYTSTTIGADIGLDVNVINDPSIANTAIAGGSTVLGVDNTAQNIVASPLVNRKRLLVYNHGNRMAYVGPTGVTTANGMPMVPGALLDLNAGAAIDIEFVTAVAANSDMRYLELS